MREYITMDIQKLNIRILFTKFFYEDEIDIPVVNAKDQS